MNKLLALPVAAVLGLGSLAVTSSDAEAFYRRGYGGHYYGSGGYYGGGGAIAAGIIGGLALGALAAPAYGYNRGLYGGNAYYGGDYYYPRAAYYNTPTYYGGYYGRPYYGRAYYGRPIVRPYAYHSRRAYYRPVGYYGRPIARYYGRRW